MNAQFKVGQTVKAEIQVTETEYVRGRAVINKVHKVAGYNLYDVEMLIGGGPSFPYVRKSNDPLQFPFVSESSLSEIN